MHVSQLPLNVPPSWFPFCLPPQKKWRWKQRSILANFPRVIEQTQIKQKGHKKWREELEEGSFLQSDRVACPSIKQRQPRIDHPSQKFKQMWSRKRKVKHNCFHWHPTGVALDRPPVSIWFDKAAMQGTNPSYTLRELSTMRPHRSYAMTT